HHKDDDNPNAESNGTDRASAGLSLLARTPRYGAWTERRTFLAKRKIRLYSRHVGVVHSSCFAQSAFPLCAFRRQEVSSRGTRPQDLATGGDLEAFRH